MKALIVVDMQKDFVDGVLGSNAAQAIVQKVAEKVKKYEAMEDALIIYTMDTHNRYEYFNSIEGKTLPMHCEKGTAGWTIVPEVLSSKGLFYEKKSFGDLALPFIIAEAIYPQTDKAADFDSIEVCGLCTGICVINVALNMRSAYTETPIIVDKNCCACVSKESHEAALKIMKNCMIEVI